MGQERRGVMDLIWANEKENIFAKWGWTGTNAVICPSGATGVGALQAFPCCVDVGMSRFLNGQTPARARGGCSRPGFLPFSSAPHSYHRAGKWPTPNFSPSFPVHVGRLDVTQMADSYVCGTADYPLLGITIGQKRLRRPGAGLNRRWFRRATVSGGPGKNWRRGSMRWPLAFLALGSNVARASASGSCSIVRNGR